MEMTNVLARARDRPCALTSKKKMAKRRSSSSMDNPLSKMRRTGIDPEWNDDFPLDAFRGRWHRYAMRKHSRRPKKSVVGKAVWTDTPLSIDYKTSADEAQLKREPHRCCKVGSSAWLGKNRWWDRESLSASRLR